MNVGNTQKGRQLLLNLRDRMKGVAEPLSPYFATVTAVQGELVQVRSATATASSHWISSVKGTYIKVGDRGLVFPVGKALCFMPLGATTSYNLLLRSTPTINSTSAVAIPDLTFPVVAGESWIFEAFLSTWASGGSSGLRFGPSMPADSTSIMNLFGTTTGPTVYGTGKTTGRNNVSSALTVQAFVSVNGFVSLRGSFTANASGSFGLLWAVLSSGVNASLDAGSWLKADRIDNP